MPLDTLGIFGMVVSGLFAFMVLGAVAELFVKLIAYIIKRFRRWRQRIPE